MTTKPRARYVTLAQLKRKGACLSARALVRDLGGKIKVTEDTATALARSLDFGWAVNRLLTVEQLQVYYNALSRLAPTPWLADSLKDEYRIRLARAFAVAYNSPKNG
jgi:hypothetical protein